MSKASDTMTGHAWMEDAPTFDVRPMNLAKIPICLSEPRHTRLYLRRATIVLLVVVVASLVLVLL